VDLIHCRSPPIARFGALILRPKLAARNWNREPQKAPGKAEFRHSGARRGGLFGDGNYHVLFLIDPNNPAEGEAAKRVYDGMIAHAHRVEGSCTGEHGIGIGKRSQLIAEFGAPVVDAMRTLKLALDPKNILNPGKIFAVAD
jgi:FAD/FMN-containing dehydrogenase